MNTQLRGSIRRIYQTACQHYQSVVLTESPILEEQILWDATLGQRAQSDENLNSIHFVEPPEHLSARPVADQAAFAPDSELRYFLDGAQHTQLLFVADTIPVCATVSATGLMKRDHPGASLDVQTVSKQTRSVILLPNTSGARPLWDAARSEGFMVEDTLASDTFKWHGLTPDQIAADFDLARYFAYERARALRREMERALINDWIAQQHVGWLVVDGDIRHLGPDVANGKLIGLVKRQRHPYFIGPTRVVLLGLPAYHRTNVFTFRPGVAWGYNLCNSFYLRWRQRRSSQPPEYGLLRVETSVSLSGEQADAVSRWIVAEGRPMEFGRDGNHLYPIARAERLAKHVVRQHGWVPPRPPD